MLKNNDSEQHEIKRKEIQKRVEKESLEKDEAICFEEKLVDAYE